MSRGKADNPDRRRELEKEHGTIGEGMDSPDSTEIPLDAQTGRPDERTTDESAARRERERPQH